LTRFSFVFRFFLSFVLYTHMYLPLSCHVLLGVSDIYEYPPPVDCTYFSCLTLHILQDK
jgi:hypothetical protein